MYVLEARLANTGVSCVAARSLSSGFGPNAIGPASISALKVESSYATGKVAPTSFLGIEKYQRHIVMQNGLLVTIIPFEGYAGPIRCLDRALIVLVFAPVDAIANLQLSGFVAGHFLARLFRPVGTLGRSGRFRNSTPNRDPM